MTDYNPKSEIRNPKSHESVARSAGIISCGVLLSRVLGLIRVMVSAHFFGASRAYDCFVIAFMIPNLLRLLLAEGALSAAFIPIFAEYLTKKTPKETWELASLVINFLLIISGGISVLGILLAPIVIPFVILGFEPEGLTLTIHLTQLMFPFIIGISLAALGMGMLNSYHHFTVPAFGPAISNIIVILTLLGLAPLLGQKAVFAVGIGFLAGAFIQVLIQIPVLIKYGFSYQPIFTLKHPDLRRIIALMGPATIGLAITQINLIISRYLASFLPEGSISALDYASIVVQLPVSLTGVAIGTATFPTISRHLAMADLAKVKDTVSWGIRMIIFTSIPATVGLIILDRPIIRLLFERGNFDSSDTAATAIALSLFSLGILGYGLLKSITPVFYALGDAKTPVKVGVVATAVNLVLSIGLMFPLAHGGLALAMTLSTALNVLILLWILRQRIDCLKEREILITLGKTILASAIMGIICYFTAAGLAGLEGRSLLIRLSGTIAVSLGTFGLLSHLLSMEEAELFLRIIKKSARIANS
ncbi:MAG: murein biosynthesis integral membrane protein MurJ [bacterium]|nr:murein biosynthesis integral membrane protein MurJ [bacterium]